MVAAASCTEFGGLFSYVAVDAQADDHEYTYRDVLLMVPMPPYVARAALASATVCAHTGTVTLESADGDRHTYTIGGLTPVAAAAAAPPTPPSTIHTELTDANAQAFGDAFLYEQVGDFDGVGDGEATYEFRNVRLIGGGKNEMTSAVRLRMADGVLTLADGRRFVPCAVEPGDDEDDDGEDEDDCDQDDQDGDSDADVDDQ